MTSKNAIKNVVPISAPNTIYLTTAIIRASDNGSSIIIASGFM